MNDQDMNELMKKAQQMIENNQIPPDIKEMANKMLNPSSSNNQSLNTQNSSSNIKSEPNYNQEFKTFNMNNSSSSDNNSNLNNSFNSSNGSNSSNNSNSSNSSNSNNSFNFDMATLMKMQNIMSKLKTTDNDDMSKLLMSLKPYMRDERKGKIDEYINLIKMGKMTQLLESLGNINGSKS